jgi:hypothetical protein
MPHRAKKQVAPAETAKLRGYFSWSSAFFLSHRLHSPLIEIDHYGERLTGCVRVQSLGVDQETLRCRNRSRVAEAWMRLDFLTTHRHIKRVGLQREISEKLDC